MKTMIFSYAGPISGLQKALDEQLEQLNTVDCGINNIIITKYADNDYSVCVTDDIEDVNSGHSVRGTLTEVLDELDANSLNILKEIAKIIRD